MGKGSFAAVVLAIIAVAAAEVTFRQCEKENQDACEVTGLRINSCTRSPCLLKKGHNTSMQFDFTPNFSADKLKTAVYWADDPSETPFGSVGIADGCLHATCPVQLGTPNMLNYSLYLGKRLPNGKFWFRWKVWNENNADQVCCFETRVQLKN